MSQRAPSPPTTEVMVVLLPSFYRRKSLDGFDWLEPDCQRAPQGQHYPTQCSRVEPVSPMWVLHLRELTATTWDYTDPESAVKPFERFREIISTRPSAPFSPLRAAPPSRTSLLPSTPA